MVYVFLAFILGCSFGAWFGRNYPNGIVIFRTYTQDGKIRVEWFPGE